MNNNLPCFAKVTLLKLQFPFQHTLARPPQQFPPSFLPPFALSRRGFILRVQYPTPYSPSTIEIAFLVHGTRFSTATAATVRTAIKSNHFPVPALKWEGKSAAGKSVCSLNLTHSHRAHFAIVSADTTPDACRRPKPRAVSACRPQT